MVPRHHRLRRSAQFNQAVRGGVRAGRRHVVVHLYCGSDTPETPLVGFIVSKAVGNSVVRHQVSRRLRHVLSTHLHKLPAHCLVVVRAHGSAATASSLELAADVDSALSALVPTTAVPTGVGKS